MSFFDYVLIFVFLIWLLVGFLSWKLIKLILSAFIKNQKTLNIIRNIFFLLVILAFVINKVYEDYRKNIDKEKYALITDFNEKIIRNWKDTVLNSEIYSFSNIGNMDEINDIIFFDFFDDPNYSCIDICDGYTYLDNSKLSFKELKLLYEKKTNELNIKKIELSNYVDDSKRKVKEQLSKSGFENQYKFDRAQALGFVNSDDYENFISNIIETHKSEFDILISDCDGFAESGNTETPLNPFPEIYGFALYMDIDQLETIAEYNNGFLECSDENEYQTEKICRAKLENNKDLRLWLGKISDIGPLRAYQIDVLHGELSRGEEDRLYDAFKDKFKFQGNRFSCDTTSLTIDGVLLNDYLEGFSAELNLGQGISFYDGNYFQNSDFNEITIWSNGDYRDKVWEYLDKLIKIKDKSDYLNSSSKFDGM